MKIYTLIHAWHWHNQYMAGTDVLGTFSDINKARQAWQQEADKAEAEDWHKEEGMHPTYQCDKDRMIYEALDDEEISFDHVFVTTTDLQ